MNAPGGPTRGSFGIGLQLTGMALCPVALAFGLADNGPVEWGLLTLGAVCFFAGHTLRSGDAGPKS